MTCETETGGLGALIHALGESKTKAVIAALDSSICEVAAKLAHLGNKPLLTWTCPLVSVLCNPTPSWPFSVDLHGPLSQRPCHRLAIKTRARRFGSQEILGDTFDVKYLKLLR